MTSDDERAALSSVWRTPQLVVIVGCLSILALLGIGVTAVFIVDQRSFTENERAYVNCQRQHNDEVIAALSERAAAGDLQGRALKRSADSAKAMVDALLLQTNTQEQRLAAVERWRDEQKTVSEDLAAAQARRDQNPVPAPRHC